MKNKGTSEKQRMWRLAGKYSSFGIELAFCLIVPTLVGNWADEKFDFGPYGLYVGMVIGLGAAFESVRRLIQFSKKKGL